MAETKAEDSKVAQKPLTEAKVEAKADTEPKADTDAVAVKVHPINVAQGDAILLEIQCEGGKCMIFECVYLAIYGVPR